MVQTNNDKQRALTRLSAHRTRAIFAGGGITVSAQAREGAAWWPSTDSSIEPSGVVVVTVNYNTKRLVSMLLWSLYRFLGSELRSVVVVGEAAWNRWHEDVRLCGYSLLIDPARAWQPEIGPFGEGGDPVGDFEQSCRRVQVPIATFPFTANGFIVPLGRGTLAGVYERREVSNDFFGSS